MSRERERRVVVAAAAGIGVRLVQAVGSFLTVPIVLHALDQAGFGVWGAATSLAWLAAFADFGVGNALITLVARAVARGETEAARQDLAAALSFACLLALLLGAIGVGLVLLTAPGPLAAPYLIAVAGLAVNIPLSIANNLWWGLQRGHLASLWDTVQTLCMIALTYLAAFLHGHVLAFTGLVFGSILLSNGGSLCHVLLTHPELRPACWRHALAGIVRIGRSGSL